jgi:hypothetical protein
MTYTRTRRQTGIDLLPESDVFGRSSITGTRELLGERRLRRWSRARHHLFHRAKNGVHDPITYFHLVEELGNIRPWQPFTSGDLAKHLNDARDQLVWDPVVVGRVLNDLIDAWQEANPGERFQPLVCQRSWSGREYSMTDYPEARAALASTVDDLADKGTEFVAAHAEDHVPRLESPLIDLPCMGTPGLSGNN